MEHINTPISHKEFCEITKTKEKELFIILYAHGINASISHIKSLNKILNNLYTKNDITLENIFDIMQKEQINLEERLNKLRKDSNKCDNLYENTLLNME